MSFFANLETRRSALMSVEHSPNYIAESHDDSPSETTPSKSLYSWKLSHAGVGSIFRLYVHPQACRKCYSEMAPLAKQHSKVRRCQEETFAMRKILAVEHLQ